MKSNYKEENKEFLRQKATEEGVHTTAQGVLYEVLQQGSGNKATIRSIVSVYYKIGRASCRERVSLCV